MTGPARRAGLLAIIVGGAALFLAALDFSINVSLPTMRDSLGGTLVSVQWIIILYHGARSGTGFIAGAIADRFGLRRLLLLGIILYTASVALISLQSSLLPVVLLRVPQGLGVAILFTLGPALVARAFGPEKRGAALGVTIAAVGAGQLTGTLGGGWLSQNIGWEAIFWARVPIGTAVLLLAALAVRDPARPEAPDRNARPFDWPAAAGLFTTLFVLVLALSFARLDGWVAVRPLALYAVTLAALGVFLWLARQARAPLLPAALLKVPAFQSGAVSNVLIMVGTFVMWFLFPFYVSDVMERGPVVLGALLGTMAAATFAGSAMGGWLADRLGDRRSAMLGAAVSAVGLLVVGRAGDDPAVFSVAGLAALLGLGFGVHQAAVYALTMRGAPAALSGTASAALAVTQTVGTVASIAVMTSILDWRQSGRAGAAFTAGLIPEAYADTFVAAAAVALLAGLAVIPFRKPAVRTASRMQAEKTN